MYKLFFQISPKLNPYENFGKVSCLSESCLITLIDRKWNRNRSLRLAQGEATRFGQSPARRLCPKILAFRAKKQNENTPVLHFSGYPSIIYFYLFRTIRYSRQSWKREMGQRKNRGSSVVFLLCLGYCILTVLSKQTDDCEWYDQCGKCKGDGSSCGCPAGVSPNACKGI